jgi:flagellar biosynthetic protein FliP
MHKRLFAAGLALALLVGVPSSWAAASEAEHSLESVVVAAPSSERPVEAAVLTMPSPDSDSLAVDLPPAAATQDKPPAAASRPAKTPPSTSAGHAESASPTTGKMNPGTDTAMAIRIVLGLTALAMIPALLVCLTSFLRIIIVLSMLRHALGMPETPPNTVLIGMAMFLTLFTMSPVFETLNHEAVEPFLQGSASIETTFERASRPLRDFMIRQTREQDLAVMVELSKAPQPHSMNDISNVQLIPAFMLSELRAAFQIGFVVFLPFLLIDLIVSSILMALGMMMMPPITVALPLKILMFILVDGWSLILKALVGSFH